MMGRLDQDQGQLFYSFRLDEVVPDDHLVRQIAGVLDLSWVAGLGEARAVPELDEVWRRSFKPNTCSTADEHQGDPCCIWRLLSLDVLQSRFRQIEGYAAFMEID
jgi:hypothetical protein